MQALATSYKQRLYFPFNLSKQHYSKEGQARAAELEPLLQSPILDLWAAALNDMTYPAQRWQAWVSQLDRLLTIGDKVRKWCGELASCADYRSQRSYCLQNATAYSVVKTILAACGALLSVFTKPAAHLVLRWTQILCALRMACYIVCACHVWQTSEAYQDTFNLPERRGFMRVSFVADGSSKAVCWRGLSRHGGAPQRQV